MSEYQYYEFAANDRPLSKSEMTQLRDRSSRATITPRSFVNEYNWGDLKGDPADWMRRYFDAFVYTANWCSCQPYEADMRHLINTYIQADHPNVLGDLSALSLVELIVETGIHDAIARKLNEKGKLSRNAIAEGIINNVRKTIIREHLTDPKFYEEMSKLFEDLIRQKRDDTESYERFLKNTEAVVKKLAKGHPEVGMPAALHGNREASVLYNNLAPSWLSSPPSEGWLSQPPNMVKSDCG